MAPCRLEDLASNDTESGPGPSALSHSHLSLGHQGCVLYRTYSACQACCPGSLTPHTSPRGDPWSHIAEEETEAGPRQIAGRRNAWDLNQVWEIPKLHSVLSCETVNAMLGLGRQVWTDPGESGERKPAVLQRIRRHFPRRKLCHLQFRSGQMSSPGSSLLSCSPRVDIPASGLCIREGQKSLLTKSNTQRFPYLCQLCDLGQVV